MLSQAPKQLCLGWFHKHSLCCTRQLQLYAKLLHLKTFTACSSKLIVPSLQPLSYPFLGIFYILVNPFFKLDQFSNFYFIFQRSLIRPPILRVGNFGPCVNLIALKLCIRIVSKIDTKTFKNFIFDSIRFQLYFLISNQNN